MVLEVKMIKNMNILQKIKEYEPRPSWLKTEVQDDHLDNDHTNCKHE